MYSMYNMYRSYIMYNIQCVRMYVCTTKHTKYIKNIRTYCQCLTPTVTFQRRHVVFPRKKAPAASLLSREQGLGIPIHPQMQFLLIHIYYYTLLVSNRILYIKCIALAIDPFMGLDRARPAPCDGPSLRGHRRTAPPAPRTEGPAAPGPGPGRARPMKDQ